MRKSKRVQTLLVLTAVISALALVGCQPPASKTVPPIGPAAVNLGAAGNYVILAKSAVSTVPTSTISGEVGLSPAATAFITGFALTNFTGYATSTQVTGRLFAADMAAPTPANLTAAVLDMETAYTDAAGRVTPDFTDLNTGDLGGLTLAPGLYTWGSGVTIPTNLTISGRADDTWIFQVSGNLSVSDSVQVILEGGAQAKNVIWQVAGTASLGTSCHFEGIILAQTAVTMGANATMNGRLYAQTNVALIQSTITQPAP